MIKAIVFDADNTLYKINAANAYGKKFGFLGRKTGIEKGKIEAAWRGVVKEVANSGNPEERQREYSTAKSLVLLGIGEKEAEKLAKEALEIFWQQVLEDLEYPREIRGLFGELAKEYVLVVASDEFRENLVRKLNRVFGDWKKYFRFLVTPEDTKSMKPNKRYYEIAMERLGLKPGEILVVGDSEERDAGPAQALGIRAEVTNDIMKIRDFLREEK